MPGARRDRKTADRTASARPREGTPTAGTTPGNHVPAGGSELVDESERMMRNLCAYALSEPDPLSRFIDLTHQRHVFEGVVAGLQRERGKALADLADLGMPLDQIVERSGLTASQVRSIVKAAGRKLPPTRKATGGRGRATAKTPTGVPGQAADASANGKASAGKAAAARNTGDRQLDNELPLAPVAARGSRMLTAEEREALGLPPLRPLTQVPEQRVAG